MFAKDLNWTDEGLNSISTGLVVSSANYHPYRYIFCLVVIILLILAAIVRLVASIKRFKDPYLFPVCTYLSNEECHELMDEAQDELDSENYLQINATYITENYYIIIQNNSKTVCVYHHMS